MFAAVKPGLVLRQNATHITRESPRIAANRRESRGLSIDHVDRTEDVRSEYRDL
jgi:hypothetical protein